MSILPPADRRSNGCLPATDFTAFSRSNFDFWRLGVRETLSGVSRVSNPVLTGTPSCGSRNTMRVPCGMNESTHDKHTQQNHGRHSGLGPDLARVHGPWAKPAIGQSYSQDGQSRLV